MFVTLLSIVSFILLAAHGLRTGDSGAALFWLAAAIIIFSRWTWKHLALSGMLIFGTWLWADTTLNLIELRLAQGLPWLRLAAILGSVCLLCLVAALLQGLTAWQHSTRTAMAQGLTFLLAAGALTLARQQSGLTLLLPDRFAPGSGWLLILVLGCYGAWIVGKMAEPLESAVWRRRIWTLFSALFFIQLLLGLAGIEQLLMTGKLHLPVPALIVAGPLYRGEGLFMVILFSLTLVLVGPAWCSHLCYIGAWDNLAATSRRRPKMLPGWTRIVRWLLCISVLAAAVALGKSDVPGSVAVLLAAAFGLLGVALMLLWSRQTGVMTHCISYCPMGLFADIFGRINPWRIRIHRGCNQCGICSRFCRYQALTPIDLEEGRAGLNCSLCGDCLSSCPHRHLHYHFPGLGQETARTAFLVVVVSLHAVFLGVARL